MSAPQAQARRIMENVLAIRKEVEGRPRGTPEDDMRNAAMRQDWKVWLWKSK